VRPEIDFDLDDFNDPGRGIDEEEITKSRKSVDEAVSAAFSDFNSGSKVAKESRLKSYENQCVQALMSKLSLDSSMRASVNHYGSGLANVDFDFLNTHMGSYLPFFFMAYPDDVKLGISSVLKSRGGTDLIRLYNDCKSRLPKGKKDLAFVLFVRSTVDSNIVIYPGVPSRVEGPYACVPGNVNLIIQSRPVFIRQIVKIIS